jgi:predicted nuclease of predicted toxin-antitoxin system
VHGADAVHVEEIGLLGARDVAIFTAARKAERSVVLLSKDDDFPKLLGQHGPPPRVALLEAGEPLVEIRRRS